MSDEKPNQLETLLNILQTSPDPDQRQAAVRDLALLGDNRAAIAPLIYTLADDNDKLRQSVIEALAGFGEPAVQQMLGLVRGANSLTSDLLGQEQADQINATLSMMKMHTNVSQFEKINKKYHTPDSNLSEEEEQALNIVNQLFTQMKAIARITEALGQMGTAAVASLITALSDKTDDVREMAAQALGEIGDMRAVEPLIAALSIEEKNPTAQAMINSLGELGDSRAAQVVVQTMARGKIYEAYPTAMVLVKFGEASLPFLLDALDNHKRGTLNNIVFALGHLQNKQAVQPLINLLNDEENLAVRLRIIWSVGFLNDTRAVDSLGALLFDEEESIRDNASSALRDFEQAEVQPKILGFFIQAMLSPLWKDRLYDLPYCLSNLKDSADIRLEPLLAIVEDQNQEPEIRQTAIRSLSGCQSQRMVETLLRLLEDADPDFRAEAAEALGLLKDYTEITSQPLIKALNDPSDLVRIYAAASLGDLSELKALEPLLELFEKDNNPRVRAFVAKALGEFGDKRAVEPLIRILIANVETCDCSNIIEALGKLKDNRAVEPLMRIVNNEQEVYYGEYVNQYDDAILALGQIGDARALDSLLAALQSDHNHVRKSVIKGLVNFTPERVIDPLINALDDEYCFVRSQAAETLGELGDKRAVDALIKTLKDPELNSVRKAAAEALGQIGDPRALEPLTEAIKSKHLKDIVVHAGGQMQETARIAIEQINAKLNNQ